MEQSAMIEQSTAKQAQKRRRSQVSVRPKVQRIGKHTFKGMSREPGTK